MMFEEQWSRAEVDRLAPLVVATMETLESKAGDMFPDKRDDAGAIALALLRRALSFRMTELGLRNAATPRKNGADDPR